jgi:hypothetical protein
MKACILLLLLASTFAACQDPGQDCEDYSTPTKYYNNGWATGGLSLETLVMAMDTTLAQWF